MFVPRPCVQLLRKDPDQRLTLAQLLSHPWLTSDSTRPLTLRPSAELPTVRLLHNTAGCWRERFYRSCWVAQLKALKPQWFESVPAHNAYG